MKRFAALAVVSCAILLMFLAASRADDADNRIGIGANYWRSIKNIDIQDFDSNGFSWLATYQYSPGLFSLETDLEIFQQGFSGADKNVFAPQALVLLGSSFYGGIGIGTYYADSHFSGKAFYALKLGLDINLFGPVYADISANYRFNEGKSLRDAVKDINSDTIMMGAAVRVEF